MQNNVIDFAAYRQTKATNEAPAKGYTDNVIHIEDWKSTGKTRRDAAIVSTTDVLMNNGYAA